LQTVILRVPDELSGLRDTPASWHPCKRMIES
jgi:hypothetical protein